MFGERCLDGPKPGVKVLVLQPISQSRGITVVRGTPKYDTHVLKIEVHIVVKINNIRILWVHKTTADEVIRDKEFLSFNLNARSSIQPTPSSKPWTILELQQCDHAITSRVEHVHHDLADAGQERGYTQITSRLLDPRRPKEFDLCNELRSGIEAAFANRFVRVVLP
ncbi:hypothetical protein B0J17DRAFT_703125 [Rhizoctonia solani]|nr:hypothetical protein B0J17DRAFT_703125 [Rhizoctonia solani]